jgi:hypothetical protein
MHRPTKVIASLYYKASKFAAETEVVFHQYIKDKIIPLLTKLQVTKILGGNGDTAPLSILP